MWTVPTSHDKWLPPQDQCDQFFTYNEAVADIRADLKRSNEEDFDSLSDDAQEALIERDLEVFYEYHFEHPHFGECYKLKD